MYLLSQGFTGHNFFPQSKIVYRQGCRLIALKFDEFWAFSPTNQSRTHLATLQYLCDETNLSRYSRKFIANGSRPFCRIFVERRSLNTEVPQYAANSSQYSQRRTQCVLHVLADFEIVGDTFDKCSDNFMTVWRCFSEVKSSTISRQHFRNFAKTSDLLVGLFWGTFGEYLRTVGVRNFRNVGEVTNPVKPYIYAYDIFLVIYLW